jgi:hypothetical protein
MGQLRGSIKNSKPFWAMGMRVGPWVRTMLAKIDLTNAFATEVALVGPSGDIEYANKKWNDTARLGGLDPTRQWNYFEECRAAVARGCAEAGEVASGLREVLDGTDDLFVTTYACPFAGRFHWYQVLISPIYRGEVRHAMTMHIDVSALQRDPLTKLPNLALFDAQLDFALKHFSNAFCRRLCVRRRPVHRSRQPRIRRPQCCRVARRRHVAASLAESGRHAHVRKQA